MKLIIGGFAQNKLSYALSQYGRSTNLQTDPDTSDTTLLLDENSAFPATDSQLSGKNTVIVNHLHRIIQKAGSRERAECQIRMLEEACAREQSELILICDELGCGVVPTAAEDRIWREDVGRILCDLAARAESVERVICGIPVRIR